MTETGWLIEFYIGGRAVWWSAVWVDGRAWTTDANNAVRFTRKEDAARVIQWIATDPCFWGAVATEHMWCPSPPGGDLNLP